jgi:hypothetical protein
MDQDLNIRPETSNLPEGNRKTLENTVICKDFLNRTLAAQEIKSKNGQMRQHQIKKLLHVLGTWLKW